VVWGCAGNQAYRPAIGGLLLSTLGWRWIFWVTVPIGGAVTATHLLRALRHAQLYGHLIAGDDALFHPGGNHSLCRLHHARQMVRSGWLVVRDGRYEITPDGQRALEANLTMHTA